MREKAVELYLVRKVKENRGHCIKLVSSKGVPDRLVLLPRGYVAFVEVKREHGGIVSPMQDWWASELLSNGFIHRFIFERNQVDQFINEWREWHDQR